MEPPLEPLVLDLLEPFGDAAPPDAELMSAWRTSCPRLPVWEEALARGLVERVAGADGEPCVHAIAAGGAFPHARRPDLRR